MTVGSILNGAFRLVREHPAAVAIWALLHAAMSTGFGIWVLGSLPTMAGTPNVANIGSLVGRVLLMELVFLVVVTVLMAASQRAVLRPDEGSFAYLRFGADELRLLALVVIFSVAALILLMLVGIFAALIGSGAAAAGGRAAGGITTFILVLAVICAMVWLEVRLSLAFPLTLMRRKIVIGESWRLTRRRFWTLFGAFVLILLMMMVAGTIVGAATNNSYYSDLAAGGFSKEAMARAGQRQLARQMAGVGPLMIVGWLVSGTITGIGLALFGGAAATAARELAGNSDEVAETFA